MWNNVLGENGLLNALQEPGKTLVAVEKAPAGKACCLNNISPVSETVLRILS